MVTNKNDTARKTDPSSSINMIGAGTVITGDIKSKGDIRVDGSLNGSIETEGKVVVGHGGIVEGDVVCKDADIAGVLKAKISVSQLRDNSRNQSTLSAQFLDSTNSLSFLSLSLLVLKRTVSPYTALYCYSFNRQFC